MLKNSPVDRTRYYPRAASDASGSSQSQGAVGSSSRATHLLSKQSTDTLEQGLENEAAQGVKDQEDLREERVCDGRGRRGGRGGEKRAMTVVLAN